MDITIVTAGAWGTLASLFFFLAALLGGDLLALRGCLLLAYIFLLINGATGLPGWLSAVVHGQISVDMMVWSLAAGLLHGCAVARMLLDELPVKWSSQDDEQLARFLNRRSGMEPLEAKEVLRRGRWLKVAAGDRVVSSVQLYENVYLLVEGCCTFLNPCCPSPATLSPAPSAQTHAAAAAAAGRPKSAPPAPQHHQQQQQPHVSLGHFSLNRSMSLTDEPQEDVEMSFSTAFPAAQPASEEQPVGTTGDGTLDVTANTSTTADGSNTHQHASKFAAVAAVVAPAGDAAAAGWSQALSPQKSSSCHKQTASVTKSRSHRLLRSGNIFSLSALNVFGVYIGFDQFHGSQFEVWAETDCLLYSWPMSALEEMAIDCSPSLAAYWRNFITYSLASEFEMQAHKLMTVCRCSSGEYESDCWAHGGRSRDFTDPPRQYEGPTRWTWLTCKRWFTRAVSPFPPHGIRHTALPVTGVMARTRVMAVAEARAQAGRSRDVSMRLGTPEPGRDTHNHSQH